MEITTYIDNKMLAPSITQISPSSLILFNICPNQYKKMYILREKTETEKGIAAYNGNAIHETIQRFYMREKFDIKSLFEDWEYILKKTVHNSGLTVSQKQFNTILKDGVKTLQAFYDVQKERSLLVKPIDVELELRTLYKGIILTSRIDLIIKNKKENIEVIDFKTNWKAKTQNEVDSDLQGLMCAWNYKQFSGKDPYKVVFHFVKTKERVVMNELKYEILFRAIDKLLTAEKNNRFPATPGNCDFCQYKKSCVAYTKKRKFYCKFT